MYEGQVLVSDVLTAPGRPQREYLPLDEQVFEFYPRRGFLSPLDRDLGDRLRNEILDLPDLFVQLRP